MPFSQSYLVIGASRIIGKDLVIQLTAKSSNKVFATVRKPTSDCEHLPNVTLLTLDQGNTKSVNAAALRLTEPVDTLIINAAIGDDEKVLTTSEDRWQEYYDTNILGPFRVVKAFLPHLRKGTAKKIIVMSSTAGSLMKQINMDFGFLGPYAVTKLHNELHESEGFTVVPLHPRWFATDMGNIAESGAMSIFDSVKVVIGVVDGLKYEDSAKFYQYDGSTLPW